MSSEPEVPEPLPPCENYYRRLLRQHQESIQHMEAKDRWRLLESQKPGSGRGSITPEDGSIQYETPPGRLLRPRGEIPEGTIRNVQDQLRSQDPGAVSEPGRSDSTRICDHGPYGLSRRLAQSHDWHEQRYGGRVQVHTAARSASEVLCILLFFYFYIFFIYSSNSSEHVKISMLMILQVFTEVVDFMLLTAHFSRQHEVYYSMKFINTSKHTMKNRHTDYHYYYD